EVEKLLRKVPVKKGDVFFIHAGLVHAIGKGVVVAEIQESSDITYRIFDYNRKDDNGNERELHTQQAIDVIDFTTSEKAKIQYEPKINESY
ncbi:MAG: mannose-6-phosphate isomerase, partial [Paludibacter sp.]